MVLKPIRRSAIPSALEEPQKHDAFTTDYFNKCDDLLSYTLRYPVIKETALMTVQRQNRNPNEEHRWLRRDVHLAASDQITYDDLKGVLFVDRTNKLSEWMPGIHSTSAVETLIPNVSEVLRYAFRSSGLKANRDYCQLVMKREFLGSEASHKPRIFTSSASIANLAALAPLRSMSSVNLHATRPSTSSSPYMLTATAPHAQASSASLRTAESARGMKNARSFVDLIDSERTSPHEHRYVGYDLRHSTIADDEHVGDTVARPVRRFQIVSVPVAHAQCQSQKGFVRAYYETYEEVREYANGDVEWTCIHHSDFSGWVPAFISDHSAAAAFPREAEALIEYLKRSSR